MNEHNHQKLLIAWFRANYPSLVLFAIPNGGARNTISAKNLQAEGVLAGVPDLFLAAQGGLFIEMKTLKGRLSHAQKSIHDQLRGAGFSVVTCHGYDEAKQSITTFLEASNA